MICRCASRRKKKPLIARNRNYSQALVCDSSGMIRVVVLVADLAPICAHLKTAGLAHLVTEVGGGTAEIEFAPTVSIELVRAALTSYAEISAVPL